MNQLITFSSNHSQISITLAVFSNMAASRWQRFSFPDIGGTVSNYYRELRLWKEKYWHEIVWTLSALTVLLFASMGYYLYLANLYLIDEVHSVDRLRELSIDEKFTIRAYAPEATSSLNDFILHYSTCPSVYEVQIIWHSSKSPIKAEDVKYWATHSKVTIFPIYSYETAYQTYFHETIDTQCKTTIVLSTRSSRGVCE